MGKPEIWFNNSPAVTTTLKVPPVSFEPSPQSFDPAFTFQIGLGDLDGDHDLDAVFSNMRFSYSQVWFNDGTGYFVDSGQEFTQQGHGVALGDVDQDGDLDIFIAVATYEENNVSSSMPSKIYLNDGGGKFHDSGQDLGDKNLNGTGVDLFDIDGDQDLDALVIHYGTPNKIYLNDGRGLFSDSGRTFPDETTGGDLDSDGDVDLFVKE
jgi:hypothetical protein